MQLDSIRKFLIIGLLSIMTMAHVVIMAWSYHETYLEAEELQDAQLAQYSRALRLMFVGDLNPDHPIIPMAFLNFGTSKLFWLTGQGEETSHSHSYGEELQRRSSRSKWLRSS